MPRFSLRTLIVVMLLGGPALWYLSGRNLHLPLLSDYYMQAGSLGLISLPDILFAFIATAAVLLSVTDLFQGINPVTGKRFTSRKDK